MLLDSLIAGDPRPVLALPSRKVFSADELRRRVLSPAVSSWAGALAGKRVALRFADNALLAMSLIVLDGVAEALLLLPGDASEEALSGLMARARINILVSDGAPFPGAPQFVSPPAPEDADAEEPAQIRATSAQTEWILATSGTTRTPKLVAHTLASLTRSVKCDRERGAGVVWGLLYDLNRFAGIQVFLQSLLGGALLVIPGAGLSLEATVALFAEYGCNALSATPTLWRKLLMTPGADTLRLRQVTMGGEIADRFVIAALRKQFPDARVIHIYASTEAGVGFAVADGREGFPLSFLTTGVPGAKLRISENGILELRPDTTEQRYLGESESLTAADGFVNSGDCVRIEGDRVLFLGRDSGAINVGGNKVRPEEVERVLLGHPWVAYAAVGAKRSGITGALVEARVVLSAACLDKDAATPTLRAWCNDHLERHKVPALLRIVPTIEISAAGKIFRH